MTLAVGFKFERPKATGVSPVLLLSDSRYSYSLSTGEVYRDDGMKIWTLAKNVFAAFAGDVLVAQRALERVKRRLAQSSSGSFDDLKSILKSSFDSTLTDGDPQQPHCILAVMASDGSSKLFYARPGAARYEVVEKTNVVIGLKNLEPILQEKINQPGRHGGFSNPNHFMMAHSGRVFRNDDDRRQQALKDAWEISVHIVLQFLEVVDDPNVIGASPPLQTLLLTPGSAKQINVHEVASFTEIARKTAHPNEVFAEADPCSGPVVELTVWRQS
jgi:hypothetical protein